MDRKYEATRAAYLRAGLVAATIINVNRRKGARLVQAKDFFKEPRKEGDHMSTAEAAAHLDRWAASVNRQQAAKKGAPQ